jgi:two-component system, NarL family, sensor histidine kinase UhpB
MNQTFRQHRALIQRIEHLREHDARTLATTLRGTLGRDLSELCSGLVSLRRQLGEVSHCSDLLTALDSTAERAQQELRRLLYVIQPSGPEDLGLLPAIERCVADFTGTSGATAEVHIASRLPSLGSVKQGLLHSALQEALTNVTRHARARHVDVWLAADPCTVQLKVCDDGTGMSATDCRKPGTLGLFGLNERLAGIGGSLRMTGSRGEGTLFDVSLPVAQGARIEPTTWGPVPYAFAEVGGALGVALGA